MTCSRTIRVAALLLVMWASFSVSAQVPGLIWRSDWTAQLPPSFGPYYGAAYLSYQRQDPFAFSSDGELLMRTPAFSGQDDEITRFKADGAVRWHVNLGSRGSASEPGYGAMIGDADGSAIVWAQTGGAVVRIGADGSLQWSQVLYVSSMAPLGSQAVAVLGCNRVYALDRQSGQVLWTLSLTQQTGNCDISLTSDAAGNGYATLFNNTANGTIVQLFKFSSAGQILWQRSDAANYLPALLGTGASAVYVASPAGVQAFSSSDGTLAWSAPGARGLCMAGTPAEPIVAVGSDIQRLAESDGQPRWHKAVSSAQFASGSAARILVEGNALDAGSGAPLWQAALPPTDQDGSNIVYVSNGLLSDGSAMFAGYAFGTSGRPFLVRADGASGQLLGSPLLLPRTQSSFSLGVRVDASTIARAAATVTSSGADLRVRAVDIDSGATRWNVHEPLDFYPGLPQWTGMAAGGNVNAVTVSGPYGGWVGAFDRTYGYKQWDKLLYQNFNGVYSPSATSDPIVDASGNVYVSYAARALCPFPVSMNYTICAQLSVVKLGLDGSIVWQHDDIFPGNFSQVFAGSITLVGNDVVLNSDFNAPYGMDSLLKLSGTDGSVLWGSPIYRQNGNQVGGVFVEPDDGNLIVAGLGWAKIDSTTGATLWSNPPENGCGQSCYVFNPVVFDDGSLLSAAQDHGRMWLIMLPATAGATATTWHPDQADTRATSSFAMTPFRDAAGNIWLRTGKRYGKSDGVFYLSRFDMHTGTLASQQAMTIYGNDPLLSYVSPWLLAAPEGGRLPVWFDANQPPALYTWGDAMLDSSIAAVGNLDVQVLADRSFAVPGDVLNFHVVASYSGTAPITGARLLFDFSWPGHATGLSCATQAASNCVIDARAGAMTATFDVQSGGHIDISGQLRVGFSSNPQLHALVAGPIGLNELDTSDNGMSVLIDQSIFKDGFE